jgi:hypothetical protein
MESQAAALPRWIIRPYRPGDEPYLLQLFERVFGRGISEAHWQWKLKEQPSPVENVWLAVDGDKPIFQYAGMPVRYSLPQGEATAMVSVDTMSDPDYRRQGLLTKVGRFTYDVWREGGIPFVIGLPNQQWGSRTKALGWVPLFPLQWLVRPLYPEALLARRLKLPAALARPRLISALWHGWGRRTLGSDPAVRIRQVRQAEAVFDRLWQRYPATGSFSIVRDTAWVNWRYLASPTYPYQVWLAERGDDPAGYAVYRIEQQGERKVALIAELFTLPGDHQTLKSLLRHVLDRCYADKVEMVATLAIPGTSWHQMLRAAGFRWSWGAFNVEIVPLASDLPLDSLRDAQKWVMFGGDYDVV